MVLSALSVIYISTPESREAQEEGLSNTYTVFSSDDSDSNGRKLGTSVANGLIIVGAICAMTFLIVLLYKYRCMKVLFGYMILASMLLLGFLSSVMFDVAVERYSLTIDKVSIWLFIYNFAVVGTASIFYGKGFPTYVTQGYLILTSVIVAWQLSHFDNWTAWVLLVLLALYDLFAVLTPCGPLKALVKLMQREDAPEMPGLLYEASLPSDARRRRPNNSSNHRNTNDNYATNGATPSQNNERRRSIDMTAPRSSIAAEGTSSQPNTNPEPTTDGSEVPTSSVRPQQSQTTDANVLPAPDMEQPSEPPRPTGRIPLALAKLYKLPLVDNPQPSWVRRSTANGDEQQSSETFSPEELKSEVEVVFPRNGGRIAPHSRQRPNKATRYSVIDRQGNLKRILFVSNDGRVFEDLSEMEEGEGQRRNRDNSIKLGLGDFIFYSILVSKAALYSFTTFAACTVVILVGLGMTLFILAIRGQALPALPISIFLGVICYLLTRYAMQPFVEEIFIQDCYL